MYRTPASPDRDGRAPSQLVYDAEDAAGGHGSSLAILSYLGVPTLTSATLGLFGGATGGVVGLAVGSAYSLWSWRRRKRVGRAVLRVDDGALLVTLGRRPSRPARFALAELTDVTLDIKTIERVTEGNGAIPALRFVQPKIGPRIDTARIVLMGASGLELPLTEEYLAHMDATEWLGRIRVFLRKHGWLPEDEREASPSSIAPGED